MGIYEKVNLAILDQYLIFEKSSQNASIFIIGPWETKICIANIQRQFIIQS